MSDISFSCQPVLDAVARHVRADATQFSSENRIERAATLNERLRLARELHDGMLQSLTAAALQLEATAQLVENNPQAARERLREVQNLIAEEQRDLRRWIESMRRDASVSLPAHDDLAGALQTLCRRVTRWGPRVELLGPGGGTVPLALAEQVYRLVEESLSNVTRHAHARVARVEVQKLIDHVRVIVEDDGCGFPFHGRYDLAALTARRLGPVSLRERIASLDGGLVLTSTLSGSRLEIDLPFPQQSISRSLPVARRA